MNKLLTVVIPCFNEEEILKTTFKKLDIILSNLIKQNKVNSNSKLLFVDDGSKDSTWNLIKNEEEVNSHICGLKLSRNYGHQNALIAGMSKAIQYSDMIITIDADLQDDETVIYDMVDKYLSGVDIVYGVRDDRQTDTQFKRNTANIFYRLMNKIGIELIPNSADFRLMSKRAVNELLKFKERNLFLRGLVPLVGFSTDKVFYSRKKRIAGNSKYTLGKMLKLAWNGITSFSIAPIKLILFLGIFIVLFSIIMILYTLIQHLRGHIVAGWSSIIISIWLIGGIQLICISIIGEYIGKIFNEVKERPRFIIDIDDYSNRF